MNEQYISEQLKNWLIEFVEKPHPKLNDWAPCPFARQARIKDKTSTIFTDVGNISSAIFNSLPLLDEKDVLIICLDHTSIKAEKLSELVRSLNDVLMPDNYVILEDHPDDIEYVNGVCMNFGHCAIMLVSKLDSLNDASNQIREKGYYNHWNQAELDQVVTWRFKSQ